LKINTELITKINNINTMGTLKNANLVIEIGKINGFNEKSIRDIISNWQSENNILFVDN